MPKAIGLFMALVALAAGVLCAVDPMTCITRAVVSFLVGWVGATVWQGVFLATSRVTFVAGSNGEVSGSAPQADAETG